MRIAAIDIGTNSIHMIVVAIRPDLSFAVLLLFVSGDVPVFVLLCSEGVGAVNLYAMADS